MKYLPSVVQAIPMDDFCICAYFSDGAIKRFDVKPLIARGGVFAQLADADFFEDRLTVMNMTAAWDVTGDRNEYKCIDIDPCALYERSVDVEDPLKSA